MAKKITGSVKLQIAAGKATPAPPVGPALGQALARCEPGQRGLYPGDAFVVEVERGQTQAGEQGSVQECHNGLIGLLAMAHGSLRRRIFLFLRN